MDDLAHKCISDILACYPEFGDGDWRKMIDVTIREARYQGAVDMRERAAKLLENEPYDGAPATALRWALAKDVRTLPTNPEETDG